MNLGWFLDTGNIWRRRRLSIAMEIRGDRFTLLIIIAREYWVVWIVA